MTEYGEVFAVETIDWLANRGRALLNAGDIDRANAHVKVLRLHAADTGLTAAGRDKCLAARRALAGEVRAAIAERTREALAARGYDWEPRRGA